MYKNICRIIFLLCTFFIPAISYSQTIREVASIQGIREYQLIGYGLVVGLNGTGDEMVNNPFTYNTLEDMLHNLGTKIFSNNIPQIKNIASVIVIGNMNSLSQEGEKIDVVVSSIGNAKNLNGGILLMTPLKGINNKVYAIAQGRIEQNNKLTNKNINNYREINNFFSTKNTGTIFKGGIIQRKNIYSLNEFDNFKLQLKEENYNLIQKICSTINRHYFNMAKPINSKIIQLNMYSKNISDRVKILSKLESLEIDNFLNIEKTKNNTVFFNNINRSFFFNKNIKLNSFFLSYKNFFIIFNNKKLIILNKTEKNYIKKIFTKNVTLINLIYYLNKSHFPKQDIVYLLKFMQKSHFLTNNIEIL
ncbi:flagellar basal body P-ring protein FlgI [Buchnera aphidicola (Kurisakia onigurumii)]|uniref:flagellar basal body P-ring protein FlgI n=1 Tax=Buchnera aphidicola TaxID=9 RepID=UPI0031B6DA58